MRLTLTVESGSLAGRVIELREGSLRLGRGDECALRFDPRIDKEVSRRHAWIQAEDGDYYIADEQSTNGTLVNGQRIPPNRYVRLSLSDTILIGRTELSLAHFK